MKRGEGQSAREESDPERARRAKRTERERAQAATSGIKSFALALFLLLVAAGSLVGARHWIARPGEEPPLAILLGVASPIFVPAGILGLVALTYGLGYGASWASLGRQARRLAAAPVRFALRLGRARGAGRCPFCHDDLAAGDATSTCQGCGTTLHQDCRLEAGSCPTLGCEPPRAAREGVSA